MTIRRTNKKQPRWRWMTMAVLALTVLGACASATEAPSTTTLAPNVSTEDPTAPVPTRGAQRALDTALIAAAWDNDVERARQLIAEGGDVNAKDSTKQSAYLIATSEGYDELLDLTFQHGADVRSLDSYNGTGLIRAAERGHATVVGRLLREGIDVDHVNGLGWNA